MSINRFWNSIRPQSILTAQELAAKTHSFVAQGTIPFTRRELRISQVDLGPAWCVELVGTDRSCEISADAMVHLSRQQLSAQVAYKLSRHRPPTFEVTEELRQEAMQLEHEIRAQLERMLAEIVRPPTLPAITESARSSLTLEDLRRASRAFPSSFSGNVFSSTCPICKPLPPCAECTQPMTQSYRSQRDGREICATCFEGRKVKGLAKEKPRHPLDAWMEP